MKKSAKKVSKVGKKVGKKSSKVNPAALAALAQAMQHGKPMGGSGMGGY